MPELPEVETISRQLDRAMRGRRILDIQVRLPKMVKQPSAPKFAQSVRGSVIRSVGRRAKLALMNLSNGWTILIHLKMTGQLVFRQGSKVHVGGHPIAGGLDNLPNAYSHVIFRLDKGATLFFNDQRQFGYLRLVKTAALDDYFTKQQYGPEPLGRSFTMDYFSSMLRRKSKQRIKPLLMDQSFIAGIGNIYAAEACFAARIRPDRRAGTLSVPQQRLLYRSVIAILKRAVKLKGASADNYVDAHGEPGRYVPKLRVYGREGERCYRCGHTIKDDTMAGRGTAWCPGCQK